MKNLDILRYLDKVKDEAYAGMKQDHFNDEGIVYYRGKYDMVFMIRAALAHILRSDAVDTDDNVADMIATLAKLRKRTILPKSRQEIDGLVDMLNQMREDTK